MLDPSLQQYLDQAKAAGMSSDAVTAELIKIGWSNEQVLEAQAWYAGKPATQSILESEPPVQVVATDSQRTTNKVFSKWKIISGAIISVVAVLLLGASAYAYLLASDKMKSDSEYLEKLADQIAVSVPFFPKTPKIVLQKAMLAHENVTQNSLDFSMVTTSSDFQSLIGSSELDIQLVGYTDLSDPENPKGELTGNITKEFSFQLKKKDPILYIKINKLPSLILGFMGLTADQLQPVIANWIAFDTTPLDTEARKTLDELDAEKKPDRDVVGTMAEKMLNEDILPALAMEKEQLDEITTYKVNFKPSPLLLDKLGTNINQLSSSNEQYSRVLGASTTYLAEEPRLSEIVQDLSITMWIDNKDYYVRKATVTFSVVSNELNRNSISKTLDNLPIPTTETAPMTVVAVLKLDNFGETLPIETPSKSITADKFYEMMGSLMSNANGAGSLNPSEQIAKANNSARSSDINLILNAIYQYKADNSGSIPAKILQNVQSISKAGADICEDLVPTYLSRLPGEETLGGSIGQEDCEKNYNTGYEIRFDPSNNKITVSAPLAELGQTISVTR